MTRWRWAAVGVAAVSVTAASVSLWARRTTPPRVNIQPAGQVTMQQSAMRKLSPVIIVDAIEPCVEFWARLGFSKTAEVPEGDALGFVILARDGVEVMYQTRESVEKDAPGLLPETRGHGAALFIEVSDVDAVERAMRGVEVVVARRRTFYGMDEIGVREPGGHVVMFAQPVPEASPKG